MYEVDFKLLEIGECAQRRGVFLRYMTFAMKLGGRKYRTYTRMYHILKHRFQDYEQVDCCTTTETLYLLHFLEVNIK